MSSSYSGYSQLAQSDAGAEPTEPPAYSNTFHTPIQPQPYPPALPPSTTLPLATFQPLQAPTATNHLAITHKHTPIRGTYTIDTSFIGKRTIHTLEEIPLLTISFLLSLPLVRLAAAATLSCRPPSDRPSIPSVIFTQSPPTFSIPFQIAYGRCSLEPSELESPRRRNA